MPRKAATPRTRTVAPVSRFGFLGKKKETYEEFAIRRRLSFKAKKLEDGKKQTTFSVTFRNEEKKGLVSRIKLDAGTTPTWDNTLGKLAAEAVAAEEKKTTTAAVDRLYEFLGDDAYGELLYETEAEPAKKTKEAR